MSDRLLGEDVSISVILNGEPQATLADIRHFEIEAELEIKKEGYLGEKTDRRDEVYHGCRGRMEFHIENQDFLLFAEAVKDRARRRTPGTQVTIRATLAFPNGDRPLIVVPDAFFGPMPIVAPDRGNFVTFGLDFEASDYTIVPQ